MKYVDCHVHITPSNMLDPEALAMYMSGKRDLAASARISSDPGAFIQILDDASVEKAWLISTVSPDVLGVPSEINEFVSSYCSAYPDRLIPFGSVYPHRTDDVKKEVDRLLDVLGVRGIKLHPCHQLFYANEYKSGKLGSLKIIYSTAQERGIPVMIHTGTSIFPKALIRFGDPIYVDDVAVDYPDLKIILAHGGRPLWTETAFFLIRRHKNVFMDISGIPPKRLLDYFPRLELIADKVMFGSDWAGPMVPGIKQNIDEFLRLPISQANKQKILRETALQMIRD